MARRTERAALALSESDREMLTTLSRSTTAPAREVTRAKVLLRYATGLSISQIQREVGVSRPTIYKCVDKALAAGGRTGLRDCYHRSREARDSAGRKSLGGQRGMPATQGAGSGVGVVDVVGIGRPPATRSRGGRVSALVAHQQEQRLAHPAGARSEAASGAILPGTSRPGVRPQDAGSADGLSRGVPDASAARATSPRPPPTRCPWTRSLAYRVSAPPPRTCRR